MKMEYINPKLHVYQNVDFPNSLIPTENEVRNPLDTPFQSGLSFGRTNRDRYIHDIDRVGNGAFRIKTWTRMATF